MSIISQMVQGNYRSNDIVATEADLAIVVSMLEGEISTREERSAGGVDVAAPASLRTYKLGVNRKIDNLSCTVNIPHLKAGKEFPDLLAQIALFDASYESTAAATGMRLVYGGKR